MYKSIYSKCSNDFISLAYIVKGGYDTMTKRRKKKKSDRFLGVILICFVVFCSAKIVSLQVEISQRQYELKQLDQEIEDQEGKNQVIQGQIEKGTENQEENVARIAFEQYGYGYPDEHVYLDSSVN